MPIERTVRAMNSTTNGSTNIRSTRSMARWPNSGRMSWIAAATMMSAIFRPVEEPTPALPNSASPASTTRARPSTS